jgi:hypothetical protein
MLGHDGAVNDDTAPAASTPGSADPQGSATRATGAPVPPQAYTARAEIAREKGLPGLYITGGDDPDIQQTVDRERPYVRLLVAMVIVIVIGGFILGLIGLVVGDLLGV